MNRFLRTIVSVSALTATGAAWAQTPLGTTFTYQGRLTSDGVPATGNYDFIFNLFGAASGGNVIQNIGTFSSPVVLPVSDGLFTVQLNFTASNAFNGDERWLEIRVRPSGSGTYQLLSPRQPLTATPYAAYALEAPPGHSLDAADGSPANAVYVNNAGNVGIGTTAPQQQLSISSGMNIDQANANDGDLTNALHFGYSSGEGLASKRTSGGNQYGLDFYTASVPRLTITVAGQVGIGTTTPQTTLSVSGGMNIDQDNLNNGDLFNGLWFGSTSGAGIASKRLSGGNQNGLDFYTNSANRLSVTYDGKVGIGTSAPAKAFHFVASAAGSASEIARIENTNATNGDGLEIKLAGTGNLDSSWNWLTCRKSDNSSAGALQGNGSGGVELAGPGNDYAEWLPKLHPNEELEPGDVVGVADGRVSKRCAGAAHVMVVSTGPIVLGNYIDDEHAHEGAKVAFVGQAPVKVRGRVATGQFLVPSGDNDGIAVAVNADQISFDQLDSVIGRAWESAGDLEVKRINCLVGLPSSSGSSARLVSALRSQAAQIDRLSEANRATQTELAHLNVRFEELSARLAQVLVDRQQAFATANAPEAQDPEAPQAGPN
ncbi:MAG TPA: hypothetical protein VGM03_07210 [Phycisphaerae bacterium]|jgi:hypothetical protein